MNINVDVCFLYNRDNSKKRIVSQQLIVWIIELVGNLGILVTYFEIESMDLGV